MYKDRDSKQSIQVTIRVRPLSQKQLNEDSRICVRLEQTNSLHLNAGNEIKKFTFDSICFNESQQQIFNRVGKKCTIDCLEGYNCTIFAYGQTGAGKTYTMMGVSFENEGYFENRGLIPRTMEFLFECIDRERENGVNFIIRCSFLEIYNEQIIDLLNKSNTNMQLREDTRKGVYVEGITEETITKSDEAMDILYKGSKSRHVGSTFYNETSSRSHSVFTMQIESKYTKNGVSNTKCRQFNFIDLAGSERTKQSTGERLKEGCNINKSLMNLASVINALSQVSEGKMQHVNYRNSKLTFLLKDSLGGNSKTNLIANISPATVFYQETLSTLGFARRAKLIKREKASINQDSSGNLESMKNEIKRLKQQVINLMSRVQVGTNPSGTVQQEKPSQMTVIMHQYVQQEIDKQTKLQLQILKLNERIIHLQNGIKQFSSNEIHLRMIINIYEDKINRLKGIEKTLNQSLSNLNDNDQETKVVITYFKNERNNFIKELENIKLQSDNNKFLKELLKEAKIMKEDGEDESLKELLIKNSNFLNNIRIKLDEMKPQKIQFEINSEFEKKITLMQQQFQKREDEYQERIDQINLDLSDFKNRNDENEKLLEEAISGQIVLEQKVKDEQVMKEKLVKQVEHFQVKIKQSEVEIQSVKTKAEETVLELKSEVSDKETQALNFKKEVQHLKIKLEKAILHETALKQEFQNLEEQKYKVDKRLLQNIEELRESKNNLLKVSSEVALLQRKIQTLTTQNNELQHERTKIHEASIQKQNSFKAVLEQASKKHKAEMELKLTESITLIRQLQSHQEQIRLLNEEFEKAKEQLSQQINLLKETEVDQKSVITNQEEKLRDMLTLINEKELNGNETNVQLNQAKVDLINAHSEIESIQIKYKKIIEELKEKLHKEQLNYEQSEIRSIERAKLYETVNSQLHHKKKECDQINDSLATVSEKLQLLQEESNIKQNLIDELLTEVQSLKIKQKDHKSMINDMKNQQFITLKNSEIQIDSLKGQIKHKDQQIEHLEKEISKTKQRLQKQIEELKKQIDGLYESFKAQQDSFTKSMEMTVAAKQKKISDLKQVITDKQQMNKQLHEANTQLIGANENLNNNKVQLINQISSLTAQIKKINEEYQQLKQQLEETKEKNERQLQDMDMVHNEQIDQKNEQLQSLIQENQALNTRIEQSKVKLEHFKNANASLLSEISIKNENYKVISLSNSSLQSQLQLAKKQLDEGLIRKDQQISQVKAQFSNKLNESSRQFAELKEKMHQINTIYEEEQRENQELLSSIKVYQVQIEKLNNESSDYVNTISLLTQENHGLNQQISEYFNSAKANEEKIALLEASQLKTQSEGEEYTKQLSNLNNSLNRQLEQLQNIDLDNKRKLLELNNLTNDLTKALQSERSATSDLLNTNSLLEEKLTQLKINFAKKEKDLSQIAEQLRNTQEKQTSLTSQLQEMSGQYEKLLQSSQQLKTRYTQMSERYSILESQLAKVNEQFKSLSSMFDESKQKQAKQSNALKAQNTFLVNENRKQASEIINLSKSINDVKLENSMAKEKINKYEQHHQKLSSELNELHIIKQKWELQVNEMDKVRSQIEEQKSSKERIYNELCREKESCNNLKMLIQNKSAQYMQLELELEEKDSIYKKLVQKIAKNENENKKPTNSEHYLKTIELLEKSRQEQIELRRQNEELKKVMLTMKETIEQKETHAREMEQKSEGYCISMHKRMEEIQKDYVELQITHEKVLKERKIYKHDYEQLKKELKDSEDKIKKADLNYLQLEKEYEELKKNESIIPSNDDKTSYINKLKAQVAALKTEKVLYTEMLNKQREEKTKLKAEMRYGKDGNTDITLKLDLEKKVNENKNLTELIFEIISQLKICVNEPKTKLEVIRTTILGAIKEKNSEIKSLRDKVKECESEHNRQLPKVDYPIVHRETRDIKALSITNSNKPVEESHYKYEKEKDPSFLNNVSRQKIKEFEKFYAKFYSGEGENKGKNV